jgi:hypothetical protein
VNVAEIMESIGVVPIDAKVVGGGFQFGETPDRFI